MRLLRDALISSGFARSCGVMELMIPSRRRTALSSTWEPACWAAWANWAGNLSRRPETPHLAHLTDLLLEIIQIEPLAGLQFLREFLCFLLIDAALRLFDKAEHIAHAQNARGHSFRVEFFKTSQFLADTSEFEWLAGDMTN